MGGDWGFGEDMQPAASSRPGLCPLLCSDPPLKWLLELFLRPLHSQAVQVGWLVVGSNHFFQEIWCMPLAWSDFYVSMWAAYWAHFFHWVAGFFQPTCFLLAFFQRRGFVLGLQSTDSLCGGGGCPWCLVEVWLSHVQCALQSCRHRLLSWHFFPAAFSWGSMAVAFLGMWFVSVGGLWCLFGCCLLHREPYGGGGDCGYTLAWRPVLCP